MLLYTQSLGRKAAVPESLGINKDLIAASSTPLVLAILAEGDSQTILALFRNGAASYLGSTGAQ